MLLNYTNNIVKLKKIAFYDFHESFELILCLKNALGAIFLYFGEIDSKL